MPYETSGSLTTDSREVSIDTTWDSQSDWTAYQSASNVEINSGAVELEFVEGFFDGFEDGDIAEYSGDTSEWFVQSTPPVYEGTYSVRNPGSDPESAITRVDETMSRGDTASVYINSTDESFSHLLFMVQSATGAASLDGYGVLISQRGGSESGNSLEIDRFDNGTSTELGMSTGTIPNDTWMLVEVTPESGGNITATLTDASDGTEILSASASDSTYSSGGIGLRNFLGSGATFDNLGINSP